MQFTSAVFALLAIGANAAVIERQDPQVTNFRTFSQTGCSAGNEGVSSIEQSDLPSDGSGCLSFVTAFHGNTEPVESIIIGGVASGCSVTVYSDSSCSNDATAAPVGQCKSRAGQWKSFSVDC